MWLFVAITFLKKKELEFNSEGANKIVLPLNNALQIHLTEYWKVNNKHV